MLNTILSKTSIAAAAFCLILNSAHAANPSTSTWQIVAPQGAGFSILMPGAPKADIQKLTTAGEQGQLFSFTYQSTDSRSNYFAGYFEFATDEGVKKAVDEVRNNTSKGKVLWQQPASLNGYQGQKLATLDGGKATIGEYFVVGRRLYLVAFETEDVVAAATTAAPFLGSFKLTQ